MAYYSPCSIARRRVLNEASDDGIFPKIYDSNHQQAGRTEGFYAGQDQIFGQPRTTGGGVGEGLGTIVRRALALVVDANGARASADGTAAAVFIF